MTLQIITYPNPILSTPSVDIDIMGPNRKEHIEFITELHQMYNGKTEWGYMVGLAAPQVGKNWNVFVALNQIFINPKMEVDTLKGYSELKEGCYSLEKNKFDYPVKRYWHIILDWIDVNGEPQRKHFRGRDAQVIQHEMAHLLGRTCIDDAPEIK